MLKSHLAKAAIVCAVVAAPGAYAQSAQLRPVDEDLARMVLGEVANTPSKTDSAAQPAQPAVAGFAAVETSPSPYLAKIPDAGATKLPANTSVERVIVPAAKPSSPVPGGSASVEYGFTHTFGTVGTEVQQVTPTFNGTSSHLASVIPSGVKLSEGLETWLQARGWSLRWDYDYDYILDAPLPIPTDDVRDAVLWVVHVYQQRGGMPGAVPVFLRGNSVVSIEKMSVRESL